MADLKRLKLVDVGRFDGRELTTTLARGEIQRALDSGEDVELVLDVARAPGRDSEVEAHSLRERAAILAVVATGAAALAGHAAARPATDGGAGGKVPAAATGMTAEQIWATAPAAVKRAYAKQDAERAATLQAPAAFHPSSGGSGFDISAPSPAEAALAGEVALLIAAAGLALRGRRQRPVKPA